eukprot:scaffold4936_cov73-Phaeocystis_antarctica.AAC.3
MAASAGTPLTPMELAPRLRARGRMGHGERVGVSERGGALVADGIVPDTARDGGGSKRAGADRGAWGGGALQRGHGAPLEPLAQLDDALGGVGALTELVDATELVVGQTAKERGYCQCADMHKSKHSEPVRAQDGLPERFQLRAALDRLGDCSSTF